MQVNSNWRFHTYYGRFRYSQMLAGLFLHFCVLCFSFTDPGYRELREKKKKTKKVKNQGEREEGKG
jgi:uncharacterized protein with GYD domain